MAKDKISDYSSTANSNTDIAGINIDEGCAPSGINDAIRTLMAQLKTWQSGGQDVYIHPAGTASAPSITANGDTNTGIFFPAADTVGISTGGTERARVDSSGNLGLGVTPSAWTSAFKVIDINTIGSIGASTSSLNLWANAYSDGSNWVYKTTAAATRYVQTAGQHQWFNAASGTAGNAITFTQAMTLGADGNLGIGTTSPQRQLHINGTTGSLRLQGTSSGAYIEIVGPSNSNYIGTPAAISSGSTTDLAFFVSSTERARIDSSGNLLVGTTTQRARFTSERDGAVADCGAFNNIGSGTGSQSVVSFYRNGTFTGNISNTGSTTGYNTSSDYRLKDITGNLTGYKERLLALEPKQGSWKVDGSEFRGFLAHEFANSYPSSVNGEKDAVDTNGNPQYQGMQAGSPEVIADLVAYIKELETRLSALEQA